MAKQTFTTGQVLTAAQMTSLQQTAMLGGAANAKVASYVLVAADAGDAITMSNASPTTITVNTGLFAAGDIVTIINLGAGACTITAGTATVDTSGSLVLAQNQGGVLRFTSASAAIFFQFATPASGDIEGVTAGTGISGGGTSGTVTITNSMATAIDAKGDLVVGTGADTFSRLAVGTNGHTLVADSAETTGLKWAAPGGGTSYAIFQHQEASGTAGGTFTAGAYRTRPINTTITNNITGCSLASNQITLPAGTYIVQCFVYASVVGQHKANLQNITDSSTTIFGIGYNTIAASGVSGPSIIQGYFTITGSKVFEVQDRCDSTAGTVGFGYAQSFGTEVYLTILISKVA